MCRSAPKAEPMHVILLLCYSGLNLVCLAWTDFSDVLMQSGMVSTVIPCDCQAVSMGSGCKGLVPPDMSGAQKSSQMPINLIAWLSGDVGCSLHLG